MRTKYVLAAFLSFALAALFPQASLAQEKPVRQVTQQDLDKAKPSGTIDFEVDQFKLIIGGQKGKGVLHYKGKTYPFAIKGLSLGASIGYTEVKAAGNVYFLDKIEDFAGDYSGLAASGTFVKGAGASSFENKKGVILSVKTKEKGAALVLGMDGLNIEMEKK